MIPLLDKSMLTAIICPSCRHGGTVTDNVLPGDLKCSQCGKWRWFQKGKRLSTGFALARAADKRKATDDNMRDTVRRTDGEPA